MNEKKISTAIDKLNRLVTQLGYPINPFELEKIFEESGLKIEGSWSLDTQGDFWFTEQRHIGFFIPSGNLGYYFWAWVISGERSYLHSLHEVYVDRLNREYERYTKAVEEVKKSDNDNFKREPEVGYIYVFRSENLYKIGRAKDPESRLKYYRTANSTKPEFEICIRVHDYINTEIELHRHFSSKNTEREWFRLSKKDLQYIKNFLEMRPAKDED